MRKTVAGLLWFVTFTGSAYLALLWIVTKFIQRMESEDIFFEVEWDDS
jgi:hypothetical protein